MGKKMLGKKMAAIFMPMHFFAPNVFASILRAARTEGRVVE
jgi:hypothetical protein